ncbi:MAG TPA: multiubiquitin domain-containing protein [Gemmataceae bacterium]|nr:multiubiquitin domain-containing protein [Gemmataceae bacterium]
MSEHPREYPFFVDGKRYETQEKYLTGAQIKAQAEVNPAYQLFLEEEGDTPDKAISDDERVDMAGREKHFFAVPPATFGCE